MSCNDFSCGTGGWDGPLPGDPDNNVSISAASAPGGITVNWTYPVTNPHAVIHSLLFRGGDAIFANAVQIAIVSGNSYFDQLENTSNQYYYWVKLVSVNGTTGHEIGPASARATRLVDHVLDDLYGSIDESFLAEVLREKINEVNGVMRNLSQETFDRLQSNEALTEALAAVNGGLDRALTYIRDEVTARQSGQEGLVKAVNTIAVGLAENKAAIVEEKTVRTTLEESVAQTNQILFTETSTNKAAIQQTNQTMTNELTAVAQSLQNLATQLGQVNAAIQNEQRVRANADTAATQALNTAQSKIGDDVAAVEQRVQTNINKVDGKVANIGALWTARVDVNGLVGGFGVYNDGRYVDSGFDVDRFWVGRTVNRVKPFIIDNNIVYIDKARIRNADIDTLKIASNAVFVSQYGSGNYLGNTINNTVFTVCSVPLVISGLNDGETAGVIVISTADCWKKDGGNLLSLDLGIYAGESSIAVSKIGFHEFAEGTTTGFVQLGNGVHTISLRSRVSLSGVGGGAADRMADLYGSIIVMAGKR